MDLRPHSRCCTAVLEADLNANASMATRSQWCEVFMSVTDKTRLCYLLPLFVNLILLLSEWHCVMLILELGDLCVVKAEPGNRPHSGMRNDKKQTLRGRARRGGRQGASPILYHTFIEDSWFLSFHPFLLFLFKSWALTWLWVDWGSLSGIFLELNPFYREDGCS